MTVPTRSRRCRSTWPTSGRDAPAHSIPVAAEWRSRCAYADQLACPSRDSSAANPAAYGSSGSVAQARGESFPTLLVETNEASVDHKTGLCRPSSHRSGRPPAAPATGSA